MSRIKESFLFRSFNTINELITQGMKAKNKFQFKNRKTLVSVIKYRVIDIERQNKDMAIKRIVIFSLPIFLSLSIMMSSFNSDKYRNVYAENSAKNFSLKT